MKILCIHAHFDDFEFVAGGLFQLWQQRFGSSTKVIVCTDGKAGHQFRTREETGAVRLKEQLQSARLGGYEFEPLRLPSGEMPREACLTVSVPLLAALWKTIRGYQPDYILAPPVPMDPNAGIHIDHVAVAEAVRKVAYMINVPHAFTPEYPADETKSEQTKVPVILTVHDSYMAGANAYDIAIDIEPVFDAVAEMVWCHQSQIIEWIPWVGRHNMKVSGNLDDWKTEFRARCLRRNQEMGVKSDRAHEFFTVTAWGETASCDQILQDFPGISREHSNLEQLRAKAARWGK